MVCGDGRDGDRPLGVRQLRETSRSGLNGSAGTAADPPADRLHAERQQHWDQPVRPEMTFVAPRVNNVRNNHRELLQRLPG
jgi:hypothetical protein